MDLVKLHLTGKSLEELRERVAAEYGPGARIVNAELVTVGGIGGFLARRHYEVTVESPETPGAAQSLPQPLPLQLRASAGITALLEDAEAAESMFRTEERKHAVSTDSKLFTVLVEELKATTGMAPRADSHAPAVVAYPATSPGDLTLLVGHEGDALRVARSMAAHGDGDFGDAGIRTAGAVKAEGLASVYSRIDAMALRAAGVEGGYPVFIAYGIPAGAIFASWEPALQDLGADQIWVAVDARLKHEDTARWVSHVQSAVPIHGLAVEGSAGTASPESVNGLGLPVGWVDGKPAASLFL